MPESTLFEALTGSIGDALARFGGARQTRLLAQAEAGDSTFLVERTAGLPVPGRVSVGRLTYAYAGATSGQLTGLRALVGGNEIPGVVATHPVGSPVIDISRSWSELDGLRGALFLDTATGEDLANLGRSLGVLRNQSLSDDDQYREVIKALAYARRGTVAALTALLDALLGPGKYTLDENPFAHPGQVVVQVPPTAVMSDDPLGKTYVTLIQPETPDAGAFSAPEPAFGHGALTMAPVDLQQPTTTAIPSAAAPSGTWVWSGSAEADDVKLVAEAAASTTSARLVSLNHHYSATLPELAMATRAEMTIVCRFVRPAGLATSIGCAGASVAAGGRACGWAARAGAGGVEVALIDPIGRSALSPWVAMTAGAVAVGLVLDAQRAQLTLAGRTVASKARGALPASASGSAAFGNLTDAPQQATGATAPQMVVRHLGLTLSSTKDYWQGEGDDAQVVAPDIIKLPQGDLQARHVGHEVIISGSQVSGRRNDGTYIITEVQSSTTCRVQGVGMAGGAIDQSGGNSFFNAASGVFNYPQDLGKIITAQVGGQTKSATVAAIYEPATNRDFSTYATPSLRAQGRRVRLSSTMPTAANVSWRLNPVFVAESSLRFVLSDAGQVTVSGQGQKLTPWAALPSAQTKYLLPRRRVLGGTVRAETKAINQVFDQGPPVKLLVNPLYVHAPLDAVDAYLPGAAAAGVDVVLRY